ncbi:MAG TPA: hypothetical protein VKX49_13125 [Bryobacteraceae bacterium]|nr:hypothetical protein [Bryobacteraceae bacterium]
MSAHRSINLLAEQENNNLRRTLVLLGDTYNLVTDAEALYDTLPQLCRVPNDYESNDKSFAVGVYGNLVFLCRRQLTVGTLTLLRGHRSDHKSDLRKAIEICAFAAKMDKHPDRAKIWLSAGTGEDAFEKFRKKFTNLFPTDDALLCELGKHYDVCAKASHPSVYGIALHFISQPRQRGDAGADINLFDSMDAPALVAEFMTSTSVHATILRVFERQLKPYAVDRLASWSTRRMEFEEKCLAAHKQWLPFVTGGASA